MKIIRKNKKTAGEMSEALEEEIAAKEFRRTLVLRTLCALLCICLSISFCSVLAFLEISAMRPRVETLTHGSEDKIRIYIDQGHNPASYHNTGASGNGLHEQDLTYDIGCTLAELLREDGRFEVCLSRPNESTVLGTDNLSSLEARVDGASDFDADYFISLHINSYTQDTASGIEVFAPADDKESYSFGSFLLEGMVESTDLKNRGMKQSSELYVLKNTDMPAVLLEMGFISNAADAEKLSAHPESFAQGIYDGIIEYFDLSYSSDADLMLWTIGLSVSASVILIIVCFAMKKRNDAV